MRRRATVLALLAALISVMVMTEAAMAKGGVEQITVSGPGLEQPTVIDDPLILEEFNPWGGLWLFLTDRLEGDVATPRLAGPYQVGFFQAVHGWVYEFSYYLDEDADIGYILLPPPNTSQGFVHPAGWYKSSDAWNEVMFRHLQRTPGLTSLGGGLEDSVLMALLGIALISGVGLAALRRGRVSTNAAAHQV
jgi:hypothetical protein